jgi:hypothetical protein
MPYQTTYFKFLYKMNFKQHMFKDCKVHTSYPVTIVKEQFLVTEILLLLSNGMPLQYLNPLISNITQVLFIPPTLARHDSEEIKIAPANRSLIS